MLTDKTQAAIAALRRLPTVSRIPARMPPLLFRCGCCVIWKIAA